MPSPTKPKGYSHYLSHIPGYNYCGPLTDNNEDPVNALDRGCQKHDQAYSGKFVNKKGERVSPYTHWSKADQQLLNQANNSSGLAARVVSAVFGAKKRIAPKAIQEISLKRKRVYDASEYPTATRRQPPPTTTSYSSTGSVPRMARRPVFTRSRTTSSRFSRRTRRRPRSRVTYVMKSPESKWLGFSNAGTVNEFGGVLQGTGEILNNIAQGASTNNRFGLECHMTKVKLRIALTSPSFTASTTNDFTDFYCRIAVVYDSASNLTKANLSSIFYDGTIPANSEEGILAFRNEHGFKRFKVIHDKTYKLKARDVSSATHYGRVYRIVKISKRLNNLLTVFSGSTAGVDGNTIEKGSLAVYFWCYSPLPITTTMGLKVRGRISFTE